MKPFQILLFSAALAVASVSLAAAHPVTPRVDRREACQHMRIHQGVRSGQLTPREAARLRAGQMRVHHMERRAKADGFLTFRERARLERAQDRQNRRIFRLKHNGRSI